MKSATTEDKGEKHMTDVNQSYPDEDLATLPQRSTWQTGTLEKIMHVAQTLPAPRISDSQVDAAFESPAGQLGDRAHNLGARSW